MTKQRLFFLGFTIVAAVVVALRTRATAFVVVGGVFAVIAAGIFVGLALRKKKPWDDDVR